jgi:ribosomal-protein-alanine N-acetyltransferase
MIVPLAQEHLDDAAAIEERDGDAHWTRAQFEKELSGEFRRFFIVQGSDPERGLTPAVDILGYGGYWKAGPEAQITNLVVQKDQRCQGLGRRLLEFLLDCARGEECTMCTLEVRQSNTHAQALYKAVGFQVKGTRPRIYKDPEEDAVLMEKVL